MASLRAALSGNAISGRRRSRRLAASTESRARGGLVRLVQLPSRLNPLRQIGVALLLAVAAPPQPLYGGYTRLANRLRSWAGVLEKRQPAIRAPGVRQATPPLVLRSVPVPTFKAWWF